MNNTKLIENEIVQTIQLALNEDIGTGDITSEAIIPSNQKITGVIMAKQDGVIAGLQVAKTAFRLVDSTVVVDIMVHEGDRVSKGNKVIALHGNALSILKAERVALNFLQRMSGIATLTRQFVDKVDGTHAKILDTRKTVPGLRHFDKWAVRSGGGTNHRIGLYDMALIKENHITAAGSITAAVERVRMSDKLGRQIEVEVTNFEELKEAVSLTVDRIMLDNMSTDEMRKAVEIVDGRVPLEASGNVTLATVADIASTGVDYISSGSLTHSVKALDLSLILDRDF